MHNTPTVTLTRLGPTNVIAFRWSIPSFFGGDRATLFIPLVAHGGGWVVVYPMGRLPRVRVAKSRTSVASFLLLTEQKKVVWLLPIVWRILIGHVGCPLSG